MWATRQLNHREWTVSKLMIRSAILEILLLSSPCLFSQSSSRVISPDISRSTPLAAVTEFAAANRLPIGIIFGKKPLLCAHVRSYELKEMPPLQALRKIVAGSGYQVMVQDGVYELVAPDTTAHEDKVMHFVFPKFGIRSDTMASAGAKLTGYISASIDGAKSFAFSSLGTPQDEVIVSGEIDHATAPEIANKIVATGSKGVWVMQPSGTHNRETTSIRIYSYHDSAKAVREISCPTLLPN